jgi:hypothetical protein
LTTLQRFRSMNRLDSFGRSGCSVSTLMAKMRSASFLLLRLSSTMRRVMSRTQSRYCLLYQTYHWCRGNTSLSPARCCWLPRHARSKYRLHPMILMTKSLLARLFCTYLPLFCKSSIPPPPLSLSYTSLQYIYSHVVKHTIP